MIPKINNQDIPYIRVGTDYFKVIEKPDRFGIIRRELKRWSKDIIRIDHYNDRSYLGKIPQFDDFIIEPNNNGIDRIIGTCYNLYTPFPHKPEEGEWKWTRILLEHVFGDQIEAGMIYFKVLYEHPKQALPVLVLVSEDRQTGKSTFLDWMNMLFGANMAMIDPDVIGSTFNAEYATSNIIGIDETIIDKQIAIEKIKSLATKKFISVNQKHVSQFKIPFFGKIILASNNEDRFMKVDEKEIRFWVRKLGDPKNTNHNILNDMIEEIPAFLHHLTTLPPIDFTKSRMVLTAEEIGNKYLVNVKEESKSGLYHELKEYIADWFNNRPSLTEIEAAPIDVKNQFFRNNNQIGLKYLKNVLKNELKLELQSLKRYIPFGEGDSKPGTPYLFKRVDFTGDTGDLKEELPF